MDERFTGWGCEDTALEAATSTLCGPTQRVRQDAIHMWHSWQGKTAHPDNNPLWERYGQARGDTEAMRSILTEPGGPLDGGEA
jgi:hypothetical protein